LKTKLDGQQFGPWALITGASSGIGREFALRIAASRINVVLVARRQDLLEALGTELSHKFSVKHRIVVADLSHEGFVSGLMQATRDLDVGLVISNAGSANPGRFTDKADEELAMTLRLSALAHAELALHFGRKLTKRGSGGILFVSAMGADTGAPFMAHDGGAKAYVQSLGLALHEEFKRSGVYVTVLSPGPTDTPALARFGMDPKTTPVKPMKVRQVVEEGLNALASNRPMIVPGRLNRIMRAIVPSSMMRPMLAKMFERLPVVSKSPSKTGKRSL
jgi:short-subunit dehydrogenase